VEVTACFSAPHRHPASGFVFAYVVSGTIHSQVEGQPLGVYSAALVLQPFKLKGFSGSTVAPTAFR